MPKGFFPVHLQQLALVLSASGKSFKSAAAELGQNGNFYLVLQIFLI